jgi:hypothetical protein
MKSVFIVFHVMVLISLQNNKSFICDFFCLDYTGPDPSSNGANFGDGGSSISSSSL